MKEIISKIVSKIAMIANTDWGTILLVHNT